MRSLQICEKYAEVAPAPILHLHRHEDGYIAFAAERDGDDWRPLVSIRASELETWFPLFRDQLLKDAYVGINADWRLRKHGDHGAAYGHPFHGNDRLRYINACYVDIDFHKLNIDLGTAIGRVINLQESGQLPHASMIVKSGRGVWLLWLIHDIENPDISQRAFPDKLELYSRIQHAIIERLLPLGADMAARDAARHLRVPGSLHSGAEQTVEWWIQGESSSGYVYTLPQLAELFKAIPTRRHRGEIIAHNPAKRRGWVALNARRLRDFNTLRALRGGFSEGCRNNAAKIYAWLLRVNAVPPADVRGIVSHMAAQCKPKLDNAAVKDAVTYGKKLQRMTDQTIANWLGVTREEAEMLEGLPPAGSTKAPRPRLQDRIAERRATIRDTIAEAGRVPSLREVGAILKAKGHAGSVRTVLNDYRALGIKPEEARPEPLPQEPLFSSTVCKESKQPPPPLFSSTVCKESKHGDSMGRTKAKTKHVQPRFDTSTVTGRYAPVLSRGQCACCGYWRILKAGTCADCANGGDHQ
jgi:hypothetical protein